MRTPLPTFVAALALAATQLVASATPILFRAHLDGPSEAPPNASPGVGEALVTVDPIDGTMRVQATFSGLLGNTTASHIHSPTAFPDVGTAGVATQTPSFVGFPLGVTAGTYDHTFDMLLASSYRAAFLGGFAGDTRRAFEALVDSMEDGTAYLNIHTSVSPGGEIRGFLHATPDVQSCVLGLIPTLAGIAMLRRSRPAGTAR